MTTIKITDIQRAVLEAAAAREGAFAWPLPEALGLGKGTSVNILRGLMKKGLAKQRRARADEPIWREDDHDKPMTVLVTRAGLAAIGAGAAAAAPVPRSSDAAEADQRRMPRAGSKLAILVVLLSREKGTTVKEMASEVGWQHHTVRGVLSGGMVRKFGLMTTSEKVEARGRVYRALTQPLRY